MKSYLMLPLLIITFIQFIFYSNLLAQEENVIIQNYNLELAKESPPHKMLSKLSGNWNLNYKLWINPNSDPEAGSGVAEVNLILGGRFIQIDMDYLVYEKDFTSEHIVGYDTEVERFSLYSIDEFGTNAIFEYGDFDDSEESIVFTGLDSLSVNPSTNERSYQYKIELYIPTADEVNEFSFSTYYLDPEGEWKPLMETSFIKPE